MTLTDRDIERFWERVNKDGPTPTHQPEIGPCWEWKKTFGGWGYGRLTLRKGWLAAHRVSWFLHNGEIPPGMLVCHRCDNPKCVNPSHLFLGTSKDNTRDMRAKNRGRWHRGEAHHKAVLTPDLVKTIRRRYAQGGISYERLGAEYGVTSGAISGIINGRNWKWLTD